LNSHHFGGFDTESFYSASNRYLSLGFSLIPLIGARDLQRAKQPAVRWGRYQHTPPTEHDLRDWFQVERFTGIGIVCGRVSRLLVLDFDEAGIASEFRRLLPDLCQTFTVRSGGRGLPHLYFKLSPGQIVPSRSFKGADLRGEGAYVVAPPTAVGNQCWQVENDLPLHQISAIDLRRIAQFFAASAASPQPVQPIASEFRRDSTPEDLVTMYQQLAPNGRNRALFQVAVQARDAGWSQSDVVLAVAGLHASHVKDRSETYKGRYAEAVRTIASAFSRRPHRGNSAASSRVSNALREWLLSNRQPALARVLDGLYLSGISPDDTFTEKVACDRLAAMGIGRRSVMAALGSCLSDQPFAVFEVVDSPRIPPISANAATAAESLKNSCEMSRGAKRVKTPIGRKPRLYKMPDAALLAARLGLNDRVSGDLIEPAHLSSPRAYRTALHRFLLERRPGQYSRAWLGKRLGISRWTLNRYDHEIGVRKAFQFASVSLNWHTLSKLIPEHGPAQRYGVFIQTADGKRFPPLRPIALRLLKQGAHLTLYHQLPSRYAVAKPDGVGIPTPSPQPCPARSIHPYASALNAVGDLIEPPDDSTALNTNNIPLSDHRVGIPTPSPQKQLWLCPDCMKVQFADHPTGVCPNCSSQVEWDLIPIAVWQDQDELKRWWRARWSQRRQLHHKDESVRLPGPDQLDPETESAVRAIRQRIPELSVAKARDLIRSYGVQLLERALKRIFPNSTLRNPAGFLITLLRSEQKFLSRFGKTGAPSARPTAPTAANTWLKNLAQSRYLDFLDNADEVRRDMALAT